MLEGLDAVPWEYLGKNVSGYFVAYGSATDIPIFIRQLISPDSQERSQGLGRLYENLLHQGSRFSGAPYALPFIIELCAESSVLNRPSLLWFWGHAITGYFSFRERPTWGDGEKVYEYGEVCQWMIDSNLGEELHQIYLESLKAKELLFNLLNNEDPLIRIGAIRVLASMPTIAELSIPKLETRLDRETEDNIRGSIAFALGELGASASLFKMLNGKESPATNCMAVCQLARINPQESLIEPLLEFVKHPIGEYRNIVGSGGKSTDDAAFAISHLPRQVQQQAIPAICQRLKQARSFDTIPLVNTLLSATFEKRNEPLIELTTIQKLVLSQMLLTDELWSIGNLIGVLKTYGLPDGLADKKEKCAKLVGMKLTTDEALTELRWGLGWAEMGGFLEKAREGIDKALKIDKTVFERVPTPEEAWLLYAKAFAEVDKEKAISAYRRAYLINSSIVNLVSSDWQLANLLQEYDF